MPVASRVDTRFDVEGPGIVPGSQKIAPITCAHTSPGSQTTPWPGPLTQVGHVTLQQAEAIGVGDGVDGLGEVDQEESIGPHQHVVRREVAVDDPLRRAQADVGDGLRKEGFGLTARYRLASRNCRCTSDR